MFLKHLKDFCIPFQVGLIGGNWLLNLGKSNLVKTVTHVDATVTNPLRH